MDLPRRPPEELAALLGDPSPHHYLVGLVMRGMNPIREARYRAVGSPTTVADLSHECLAKDRTDPGDLLGFFILREGASCGTSVCASTYATAAVWTVRKMRASNDHLKDDDEDKSVSDHAIVKVVLDPK